MAASAISLSAGDGLPSHRVWPIIAAAGLGGPPPGAHCVRDGRRPRVMREVPGMAGPRAARSAAGRAEDRIPQATPALHALARFGRTCILHGTSALRSRPSGCPRPAPGSGSTPAADWLPDAVLPPGRRGLPEVSNPRTNGPGDPGTLGYSGRRSQRGLQAVCQTRAQKRPAHRVRTGGAIGIGIRLAVSSSWSGAHRVGLDRE